MKRERKRTKAPAPDRPSPRDPLLAYKKPWLVTRVREEMQRREEWESQYATLLQEYVQRDVKIAELEAELAHCRSYLEKLHLTLQQQEHSS